MKAKRITEILQAHPTTKHQNTRTTENHSMSISHILRKQGRYYEKTKQAFISQAGRFLTQLHIQNYPAKLAGCRLLVASLRKALSLRNGSSYYVGL